MSGIDDGARCLLSFLWHHSAVGMLSWMSGFFDHRLVRNLNFRQAIWPAPLSAVGLLNTFQQRTEMSRGNHVRLKALCC